MISGAVRGLLKGGTPKILPAKQMILQLSRQVPREFDAEAKDSQFVVYAGDLSSAVAEGENGKKMWKWQK